MAYLDTTSQTEMDSLARGEQTGNVILVATPKRACIDTATNISATAGSSMRGSHVPESDDIDFGALFAVGRLTIRRTMCEQRMNLN